VLILRAVVDQQQDVGRRQALDEAVEHGLGLGVDPVEVFEDQEQELYLAFAQQHALELGEGALPPLGRIECQEGTIGGQHIQERQQRREDLLESLVQSQEVPRDLCPNGARLVSVLDVQIAPEQIDNRDIGVALP
jgi:hypothetical protein